LLKTYKKRVKEVKLVPGDKGCFEVILDGKLIYSKLAKGHFPKEGEVIEIIGK